MSTASVMVAAIDAALLALVTNRVASYDLNSVSYTYNDITKLKDLRKYYAGLSRSSGSRVRLADISG